MSNLTIIAELAWAHDGSIEKAVEIMRSAKKSGATAISIHVTDMPTYMVPEYGSGPGKVSAGKEVFKIYDYLNRINLSNESWIKFSEETRREGLDLVVMPNDTKSLIFCEKMLEASHYVISAAAFVDKRFVNAVGSTNKPVILRIGGATLGEIQETLSIISNVNSFKVTLLHGFQNYPTVIEELNIKQIKTLREIFNVDVGLADHIDGESILAKIIPIMALAFGATCIEKHITKDRLERGEDFEAALDPAGFKEFVEYLHQAQCALGNGNISPLTQAALNYRDISRKKMVATRDIKQGAIICDEDLTFMRSDLGMSPSYFEDVCGRIAKINISAGDPILKNILL